jgi:hypothetical protein
MATLAAESDTVSAYKTAEQEAKSPLVEKHAEKAVAAMAPEEASPAELAAATDKMVAQTAKLDDFYQLGRCTYIVTYIFCLFAELMILAQVFRL